MRKFLALLLIANFSLLGLHFFHDAPWAKASPPTPGPALDSSFCADANGDGTIDIGDPVTILTYLFSGGPAPYCLADGADLEEVLPVDHLWICPTDSGDDTALIQSAAATAIATGKVLAFQQGAVFTTTSRIVIEDQSHFRWQMNKATIRRTGAFRGDNLDGIVLFHNCTDFRIDDGVFDGNRDNRAGTLDVARSPANIDIRNACKRFRFDSVQSVNAIGDGFLITSDSGDPTDPATYPQEGSFVNCIADTCYRAGLSFITALNMEVLGGTYKNTDWRGISFEPNFLSDGTRSSIDDVRIVGVHIENNGVGGIHCAGPSSVTGAVEIRKLVVTGCSFRNPGSNPILTRGAAVITNNVFEHISSVTRAVIDIGADASNEGSVVSGNVFRNITAAAPCVYTHSQSKHNIVSGNTAMNVRQFALCFGFADRIIDNTIICGPDPLDNCVTAAGDMSVVSGNFIQDSGVTAIQAGSSSIVAQDIHISGNQIVNAEPSSEGDIRCNHAAVRVENNALLNAAGDVGIRLTNTPGPPLSIERNNKIGASAGDYANPTAP